MGIWDHKQLKLTSQITSFCKLLLMMCKVWKLTGYACVCILKYKYVHTLQDMYGADVCESVSELACVGWHKNRL